MLDEQEYPAGVRLFLWNNNRADHQTYLEALSRFKGGRSLHRVDIVRTPFNLGSIARFYWARKIAVRYGTRPIIVLDDDQDVTSSFVRHTFEQYEPQVVAGWWAFKTGAAYFDRKHAGVGDQVDHVGPGGMVCDAALFKDPAFFLEMPEQFWFVDDLWFTYFARRSGYRLKKLDVEIAFVMDETNQHHHQVYDKVHFFEYLYPDLTSQADEAVTG